MNSPGNAIAMVAILRGLAPTRAPDIGAVLVAAGFRTLEVPLNSPQPLRSIELLAHTQRDCLVGAGTVLTAAEVDEVHAAGGRLVVAPNCNPEVIQRALSLGMRVMPGVATATEAFVAVQAGATELKLFPAATYGAGHLRALRSVLPATVRVYAVGGVGPAHVAEWLGAGAQGFGFGGELFKPDFTTAEVADRARALQEALRAALAGATGPA